MVLRYIERCPNINIDVFTYIIGLNPLERKVKGPLIEPPLRRTLATRSATNYRKKAYIGLGKVIDKLF